MNNSAKVDAKRRKQPPWESEEDQHDHAQTEQTHSLGQSEAENWKRCPLRDGLSLERRSISNDEGSEDVADTSTRSGHTDCSGSSSNVLLYILCFVCAFV
ncbi:hypothetical protein DdX_18564 [Ditylenchus destructor]|uniref:Uncharacterized protein n=1 Tax=Ditylenchus destructor TaxID=166010 RepID=A0AAD4MJY7_9BILA|nr:hypothetical protein DdX_18564 [Ditylenchus destructor]